MWLRTWYLLLDECRAGILAQSGAKGNRVPAETTVNAPTTFDEIVGHAQALETLERAFLSGRAHHALLLDGPPGVGKRAIAHIFGRSLLCKQGSIGRPCNTCGECRRVLAGSHPDWLELEPDGANIKIAAIRQLTQTFTYRPFEGGRRVALIDPAERMTDEAANALLKTLEEPPAESYFLLVTSNRALLLPTIVSRCQHLPFSAMSAQEVQRVLNRLNLESTDAAARYSGGSPGKALELLEDRTFADRGELFGSFLDLADTNQPLILDFADWSEPSDASAKAHLSVLARKREQTRSVLELLKILLRDLFVLSAGGDEKHLLNTDMTGRLTQSSQQLTWQSLSAMLKALREAEMAVDGNVTPRLVLENLAARVAETTR